MDTQKQEGQAEQQKTEPLEKLLTQLVKRTTAALQSMDRIEVTQCLTSFTDPQGRPKYDLVLAVPLKMRLPVMMEQDIKKTYQIVGAAVVMYLGSSGIDENLAVDIAGTILDECGQDQLSIQDVLLFLKGAAGGKYGKFLRNVPTPMDFMEMFEQYRQERHVNLQRIREEQHAQLKGQGPTDRECEDRENVKQLHKNAVMQHYLNTNK